MITKGTISYSKKQIEHSQTSRIASKNIIFYHKSSGEELTIDLLALVMPAEINLSQATPLEISGAQLFANKKNLRLVSSIRGELIQGLDYLVSSSTTIQLIGGYKETGSSVDELFIGTINSAPISELVAASTEPLIKKYVLNPGETTLNLGQEYRLATPTRQFLKVYIGGVLAEVGVDYQEVTDGYGHGTTLEFLSSPDVDPWSITVDFGKRSVADHDALGAIENLSGAIKRIADDLADVAGTTASEYYNASPSEIERRVFGDMVLGLMRKVSELEEPVGTVASSFLTEAQYQSIRGTNWVLADGRDVSGSKYHSVTGETNIPDARGVFLRGKDHGKGLDTERALGNYQADEIKSHRHIEGLARQLGWGYSEYGTTDLGKAGQFMNNNPNTTPQQQTGINTSSTGGAETRPKNITVNYFVKIN